jgi:hypothetical protein
MQALFQRNVPFSLALAVAVFGAVKILFTFFAWLFQPEDPLFRRHLDTLWDKLHSASLHDAAIEVLGTIHARLDAVFSHEGSYEKFSAVCLVVNYICCVLWVGHISTTYFHVGFIRSVIELGFGSHLGLFLLALSLAILDAGSLYLTIALLGHIAAKSQFSTVLLHIVAEIAVIIAVFLVAMAVFHFIIDPRRPVGPGLGFILWAILSRIPELLQNLPSRPLQYFYVLGTLTAIAAFPTLTYAVALFGLVLIWPAWMWRCIRRIIYLVTTDKAPVMKQLGDFCGYISALATFIAKAVSL